MGAECTAAVYRSGLPAGWRQRHQTKHVAEGREGEDSEESGGRDEEGRGECFPAAPSSSLPRPPVQGRAKTRLFYFYVTPHFLANQPHFESE